MLFPAFALAGCFYIEFWLVLCVSCHRTIPDQNWPMSDEMLTVGTRDVLKKTIFLYGEWSLRWAHVNFRINEITALQKMYRSNQSICESHIYCAQFLWKACNSSVVGSDLFLCFALNPSLSRAYVLSRNTDNSVCSSMYIVNHKGEVTQYFESLVFTCICV